MTQPVLFTDDNRRKEIVTIATERLQHSSFNPRRMRPQADIDKLANRMLANGYEITRAVWAHPVNEHFEVFAGGTRLEAAKAAGLQAIPVVVHSGYEDTEVIRLADQDNENDEYHAPVPIVDVWMSYKKLDDADWSRAQIAQAKGCTESRVSERLDYANFPKSVLSKFQKQNLKESHAAEIVKISKLEFSAWLTRETAMLEVIETTLSKTLAPTADTFKRTVDAMNGLLDAAQKNYAKLEAPWNEQYVTLLAERKVRSQSQAQKAYGDITKRRADHLRELEEEARRKQSELERQRVEAEREERRQKEIASLMNRIVQGDARTAIHHAPQGFKLLLTDPPYGVDFQSNRRVVSAKAPKIAGDDETAFALLKDVLTVAYKRMADDATALIWTSVEHWCAFRNIAEEAGFAFRGQIIWNKPNHGSGDLEHEWAPKHELVLHVSKGNPKLTGTRPDSVQSGNEFIESPHPTKKPLDLLRLMIKTHTEEGDCVVDPFAGCGSTPYAAYQTGRDFWACELDQAYHAEMSDRILRAVTEGNKA